MTTRVSPPRIFPQAAAATRPPVGAAGAADAYRQASFVLGADIDLVLEALNAEGEVAEASSGARQRTQPMVAALGLWSRAWLCRLQALHAIQWGNYAAAMPLVRSAADLQAAQLWLMRTGAEEWVAWLESGGVALATAQHATEYRLHAFRSGEILASHAILGPVYRAATDLALSHFGATLLLAGNDSTPERVLMTFADRDYHHGLAELLLGWLHLLASAQAHAIAEAAGPFVIPAGHRIAALSARAAVSGSLPDRCRVETIELDGVQRYLVHNWRRAPGATPKRLLL
jgi:hypothetical protein